MNVKRRAVLEHGAKTTAVGVLGLWGGCLQQASVLSSTDDVSVPDPKRATYRQWLPSLDAVEAVDDYAVRYESVADLRANRDLAAQNELTDWLVARRLSRIEKRWDDFGLAVDDVRSVVRLDGVADYASPSPRAYVVQGSYDPEKVGRTLAESGFSAEGTYRGYQIYRRGTPPRATGVSDEAIVHARASDSEAFLRSVVDAKRGEVSRRYETDDDIALLTEEVGQPILGTLATREGTPNPNPEHLLFEGGVGTGKAWFVEDSTVYARYVLPFESEDAVGVSRVRDALTDDETFDRVEISSEGRVVFVKGVVEISS